METKVVWSVRALNSYENIINFLYLTWNENVIEEFQELVDTSIQVIINNPVSFPKYERFSNARKVVVHANVSLFYDYDENTNEIILLFFFDNRQNPDKLKLT